MLAKAHTITSLRFRRWSRKSYAAFQSIGKHVTIGNLKNIIADTFLGKQKNTSCQIYRDIMQREMEDEAPDPPDEKTDPLPEILPVMPKSICFKAAYLNLLCKYYSWLMALLLSAIFYFNS